MDAVTGTLAGRYELGAVIGRGGMGIVYRATDLVLERTVAVKVLGAGLVDEDPSAVARFEREARATAALAHPAVVAVFDTGADGGLPFIVMECVAGRSLAAIIDEQAPLEPDRAVAIAGRVAEALSAAHAAGIVHRDIKPANVMVADDGTVKVLDFGIARVLGATTLTRTDAVLGSTAYMSPEQALGERVDERSDIYSLGCVLYAMLAGEAPFAGGPSAAVLHQHVNVMPRSVRESNRRVSPALDALVMQMLAKSPEGRPQSARTVRDRLDEAQRGATARLPVPTRRIATTPSAGHRATGSRRRRLVAGAALAGAAVVIAIAALAAGGDARHPARVSHRSDPASKRASAATSSSRTATTSSTRTTGGSGAAAPATASSKPPETVASATGALTALVTQDVESGTIDQRAGQQIANALADILNSYEQGHTPDVAHELADLTQKVTMLESHSDVTIAAAGPLDTAVTSLGTTLTASAPQTATEGNQPTPPSDAPPHKKKDGLATQDN